MSAFARFVIVHTLLGLFAGVVFVAFLLALNVGGLRDLIMQADNGRVVAFWLTALISSTFASAQIGFAVMFAKRDDD